jgi:hypothetical protein
MPDQSPNQIKIEAMAMQIEEEDDEEQSEVSIELKITNLKQVPTLFSMYSRQNQERDGTIVDRHEDLSFRATVREKLTIFEQDLQDVQDQDLFDLVLQGSNQLFRNTQTSFTFPNRQSEEDSSLKALEKIQSSLYHTKKSLMFTKKLLVIKSHLQDPDHPVSILVAAA